MVRVNSSVRGMYLRWEAGAVVVVVVVIGDTAAAVGEEEEEAITVGMQKPTK